MPDAKISCVNDLSCNAPNQFIFTDRRGCPIVNIYITGEDRDSDVSNNKKDPQDPHHKNQATQDSYEDQVIPNPNIYLVINHGTPKEQVQAPEEPPADTIKVKVQ